MSKKLVTAIVVNWNGNHHLKDCFTSLLNQDYPSIEIIMVDNNSVDGSVEFMKKQFPEVRLVENPSNIGFGPAVNRGIVSGKGEYFLFLNNDLTLKENCITELVHAMKKTGVGAVIPKILIYDKRDTINSYGVDVNYLGIACPRYIFDKDSEHLKEEEAPCGGIFMLPGSVVEKTGGFDESIFFYHEDHDLSWRIRLLGLKMIVNPKAVIYHKYHFSRNKDKFYHSEKNRLYLLLKNYSLRTLLLVLPAAVLVEIAQIFFALSHGWFFKKIKSYFEILMISPVIIKNRRAVQKNRKVNDGEIVKIMTGRLAVGGIKHPLLDNFLSPVIGFYWKLVKEFV